MLPEPIMIHRTPIEYPHKEPVILTFKTFPIVLIIIFLFMWSSMYTHPYAGVDQSPSFVYLLKSELVLS